jgi:hypothetical protein
VHGEGLDNTGCECVISEGVDDVVLMPIRPQEAHRFIPTRFTAWCVITL